jgi:hypothetical protein
MLVNLLRKGIKPPTAGFFSVGVEVYNEVMQAAQFEYAFGLYPEVVPQAFEVAFDGDTRLANIRGLDNGAQCRRKQFLSSGAIVQSDMKQRYPIRAGYLD